MTDSNPLSKPFVDPQEFQQALTDIEQAFSRFERILIKYLPAIQAYQQMQGGRFSNYKFAGKILSSALDLLDISGNSTRGQQESQPTANRFPSSSGQILADLFSSLQGSGGRNL